MMAQFYREMLKNGQASPAAALRSAQLSMLKDKRWESPYFWSGFVLQGEWR
jgi:CHAT domain-containing protein